MLDINWIRANAAAADRLFASRKNVPFSASELIALDDARKTIITRLEEAQAARNAFSKQIGQAKAHENYEFADEIVFLGACILPRCTFAITRHDSAINQKSPRFCEQLRALVI